MLENVFNRITVSRGVHSNLSRGKLKSVFFPMGLSTRWGLKTPGHQRFYWFRGWGRSPYNPPLCSLWHFPNQILYIVWFYIISVIREGTPGRHEPQLCRHEPPRFARQTEPQLCSNEVFQRWEVFLKYHKKCLIMTNKVLLHSLLHSGGTVCTAGAWSA